MSTSLPSPSLPRSQCKTIPVAAAQLGSTSLFEVPYGPLAAATVVGTLPLVLLVLFFPAKDCAGTNGGIGEGVSEERERGSEGAREQES